MRYRLSLQVGAVVILANMAAGCDKLGIGSQADPSAGAPTEEQLRKISYMSSAVPSNGGRKLYSHYEEAKTCGDFELAMRWNRPPGVEGGPFHQKVVYLTSTIPADLPKDSEVFVIGKIVKGETLPSGSAGWYVRMADGTLLQAIEAADFWEKEEQASQEGQFVALVKPNLPGRVFCGQGVYEGQAGKDPADPDKQVPLLSVLFAMDRGK